MYFSDGSAAQWGVLGTDGQGLNNDTVRGQWHSRTVPLDGSNGNPSYVGKTLTTVLAVNDVAAPDGAFDMYFTDMAVVNGSTGAASAVFNAAPAQAVSSWSIFGGSSVTGVAAAIEAGTTDPSGSSAATTHYYLDDHLGTAQAELNAWGLPMWQGQFTPFGSELPDGSTTMHYKFTGKERDAETGDATGLNGLDYFGARYYTNTTGRWMSPDWAEKSEEVPYAILSDPQSLNLYSYVGNNPLSKADADGHQSLSLTAPVTIPIGIFCPECILITGGTVLFYSATASHPVLRDAICSACFLYDVVTSSDRAASPAPASTEQGRDEQGKFLPVQPGQTRPGAQTETEALEAEGASKNTKPLPGSTRIPDGTVDATGQKVEVKGGKVVGNTEQLREMGAAAVAATGQRLLVVTTNPKVKITRGAQQNTNLEIRPAKKTQ